MLRVPGSDPAADSIERHLAEAFGTPVRVGILLGTRRVNQKPVLQVFDLDGRLLGYAKVGHNELTAALVRREAAALASVGAHAPRSFRTPQLIQHARWSGLEILVTCPMVAGKGDREVPRQAQVAAMLELAHLGGSHSAPLAAGGFWGRLRNDLAGLSAEPTGAVLTDLAGVVEGRFGDDHMTCGGWHGDWSRWNTNLRDGIVQIWDWERYDPDVPMGFDGLHVAAQAVRPGGDDERRQEEAFLRSVPHILDELAVDPAQHELTLRLYLLTIAARYVDALTHGETPALRRRVSWVLSLLERLCEHPSRVPMEGRT
jgi:hypothetical protein